MSEFKIPICPPPEIRSALLQYGAKHDITQMYAIQQCILKTLRNENLITQEIYEYYLPRFSRTISSMSERPKPVLNAEQQREQQRLDEKTRYFQAILTSEWAAHESPEWRRKTLLQAEQWQTQIPEAKLLIERFSQKVFVK